MKKGRLKEVNSLPQFQVEEAFYLQKEHIVSQLRSSNSPVKSKGDQAPPNQCVFVSNLPFDVTWEDLKNLFVDKVDTGIGYVEILFSTNGTSKAWEFVVPFSSRSRSLAFKCQLF